MKTKEDFPQPVMPSRMLRITGGTIARTIGAALVATVMFVVSRLNGGEPARPKILAAADVIRLWSPRLENHTDYGQMGGSPEQAPGVAAWSFRLVGPTFEELWNHYAGLCGIKKRYVEKTFLINSGTGPNGSYVVSERASTDGDSRTSVFLLKTDTYTVTATFHLEPDGTSIIGSLTAVVP